MSLRRVAFAIPGDITTLTGGYIYERRLLLGLRALGHDVAHIPLTDTFPDPSPADAEAARQQLAAVDPDHALILDGFLVGALDGLEALRAPILAMVHHPLALETGLSEARRSFLYETERRNLTLARHVLVPSPHTAQVLQAQYDVPQDKITIARPGTDRPSGTRAPTRPPLILSVGIQHPRKGHDVLLDALARLRDLDWRCVIVGRAHDADYAAKLAAQVTALNLAGHVTLAGTVPQDRLEQLYSDATLFALATRYEGYGIVFDEALRWGLPIVSCKTGAVPDTVPADAGLLTAPGDAEGFAASLRMLLTDTGHRTALEDAAAKAGAALPSWEDTARVASRVLEELL